MSFEANRILEILQNTAAITATIDTFTAADTNDYPAIFNSHVFPDWVTKSTAAKTINFYRVGNVSGGLEYGDYLYTINCRAENDTDAEAIQSAVFIGLNRKASNSDGFFICTALPVIGPQDKTDNYNAPVEVRLKTR